MTARAVLSALSALDAPHRLRTDPPVTLRRAEPGDATALRILYLAQRAPEFAGTGLSEPMLAALLDTQYRAQQMGYAGTIPDLATYVLTSADALVGRLMLGSETRDAGPASLRVVDIAIDAAWRGQGLGSTVLGHLADMARAAGLAALTLQVSRTNPCAQRLYTRLGFAAEGYTPESSGLSIAMRMRLA